MSRYVPAGTVTFLFTDIEGSTVRWEKDQEAMAEALRRHDAISSEAVEAADGVLFKATGDGCCAVFSDATSAVESALSLRERLAREEWPESIAPLRVRMAIHTGPAEERGGDYFGPTLNRVARLMAAGHGGQILASKATWEMLRSASVPGRDLGEHRLRDLLEPEHIYQLGESTEVFEPLRTLDPRTNNLPIQVTPFVGRTEELAQLVDLVPATPLVTLTGPGGTGKTRLALQAAAELIDHFGGVYFVELAHVRRADEVGPAISDAIGLLAQGPAGNPLEPLLDHLAERRELLVLDNLEQVEEAALVVGSILDAVADVSIVVTSREFLHLRAERHYPVPPLDVPEESVLPTATLAEYESVKLFAARATAANPAFALDESTAPDVAAICRSLDGLPLAIELAAAHIRLFGAAQLRSMLEADLKVLAGGPVDSPTRHQTLVDTIKWSYDLLSEGEQTLFRRLGIFSGGWSLEAIEMVCLEGLEYDAISAIGLLADKSLVRARQGRTGEVRQEMLETIRAFALTELKATGEFEALRERYGEYFAGLAERAEPELRGRHQTTWMGRLEDDGPNLEATLTWSLTEGDPTIGMRVVGALRDFWFYQGRYREMGKWADLAVSRLSNESPALQAGVYLTAGFYAYGVYREDNQQLLRKAIELYGEAGDDEHRALAMIWLAGSYEILGNLGGGLIRIEEGLALAEQVGAMHLVAQALNMWGEMERSAGNYLVARQIQERGLTAARQTGEQRRVAMFLHNLGLIAHHLDDDETAERLIRDSLDISVDLVFDAQTAHSLLALAEHVALRGKPETAAQLIGGADAFFRSVGLKAQPADAPDYDRIRDKIRGVLGDAGYEKEVAEGSTLTLEDAVELARFG